MPKQLTYCNGESGEELVKMTLDQAKSCSQPGKDAEDDVRAILDKVEWLAPIASMRKFLKGFGAWDDLSEVSDERIKIRTLWIAAGDISERPEDYGG